MKISKKLLQFTDEKAILAVTGKQEAIFYRAHNGEIEKINEIKIESPKYSDKEGFFKTRMKGAGVIRAGSVLKPKKWKVINEFNRKFLSELKKIFKIEKNIISLYLFSPPYAHKIIENEIPPTIRKHLKILIKGDYCHKLPFEILEKIKEERVALRPVLKKEAAKIIKKPDIKKKTVKRNK
jgi:hypothetical protein